MRTPLAIVVTTCIAACTDASLHVIEEPSRTEAPESEPVAVRENVHELVVVAHQDDDLLFTTPDVAQALTDEGTLTVAYLTGGDAGKDTAYYLERERGVQAAYAERAGISTPSWRETVWTLAGHAVVARSLEGTGLTLLFFRLPDGNGDGKGFATSRGTTHGSLAKLWDNRIASLRVLDSADTYGRASLVRALSELVDTVRPTRMATLDPTVANGSDHSDHRASALFAQLAAPPELQRRLYRGYNVLAEPSNVDATEASAKWQAFLTYAQHDTNICPTTGCNDEVLRSYSGYAFREYPSVTAPSLAGAFGAANELCIDATGDAPRAVVCGAANALALRLGAEGLLGEGGHCLLAGHGGAVTWGPCAPAGPEHRWTLLSSGNLIALDGTCLRAPSTPGKELSLVACDRNEASLWSVRWSPDQVVLDRAADATPRIFGDVDGDGAVDVCMRTSAGLACTSGGAPTMLRNGAAFADARGWRGTTLQMLDLDGDGRVDVCGLRGNDVECAFGEGASGLTLPLRVSSGGGFADAPSSLGFADVDGDGRRDACVATGKTLRCAHGKGRSFDPWQTWLEETTLLTTVTWVFADVSGDGRADACALSNDAITCAVASEDETARFIRRRPWALAPPKSRLVVPSARMADIDGDGDVDVCVRGPSAEIMCATSTGAGFGTFLPVLDPSRTDRTDRFDLVLAPGARRPSLCRWGMHGVRCAAAP